MVLIPRVGKEDVPAARAEPVARLKAMAAHNGLPIIDLTDTFDQIDPASLAIAAWDNHPNAMGHRAVVPGAGRARSSRTGICTSLIFQSDEKTSTGARPPMSREQSARTGSQQLFFSEEILESKFGISRRHLYR